MSWCPRSARRCATGATTRQSRAGPALQRVLHTLKGSSRMAGAMAIGELTHTWRRASRRALGQDPARGPFQTLRLVGPHGYLFERLQSPALLSAAPAPAMPSLSSPRRRRPSRSQASGRTPAAEAKPAAPKPFPFRAQLQPKALLRVRADVVDRLVNQAARSRLHAAGSRAKCAPSRGHA